MIPSDVGVLVHKVGDKLIWTLSRDSFLDWLRNGVGMFVMADAISDAPEFRFQLPAKYERLASANARFISLIDEVECVSLRTADLTDEWRIRLRNQGEQWLPFRFRPEWFEEIEPDQANKQELTGQHSLGLDALLPQVSSHVISAIESSAEMTLVMNAPDASTSSRGGKAKTTSRTRRKDNAQSGTRASRAADQPSLSEQAEEPPTQRINPEDGDETNSAR